MTNKKYYPRFRQVTKTFSVEVCEGSGTPGDPCRLVFYVHTEDGKLLGVIDPITNSSTNNAQRK